MHLTECSGGDWTGSWHDNLNSNVQTLYMATVWYGGQSVQHWNLALDDNKGPTTSLGGCKTCRGVITIHNNYTSVTNNVEYYGMAQFGRFLSSSPNRSPSRHCATSASGAASGMSSVGYLIPHSSETNGDNAVLLGILNTGSTNVSVRVVHNHGVWTTVTAVPGVTSLVWRAQNQHKINKQTHD